MATKNGMPATVNLLLARGADTSATDQVMIVFMICLDIEIK